MRITAAMPFRPFILCASCFPVFLIYAVAASAQVGNLDKGTLIDGLAEQGMSEILLHLVETEPSDDPAIDAQVRVAQQRIAYQRLADRALVLRAPGATPEDLALAEQLDADSRVAFDAMLTSTRQLIESHYDHEQRPIWQTDLAEALLVTWLQEVHGYAGRFYEFGVVDDTQREAFIEGVAEALAQLTDADLRFFELQSSLPRQDEAAHQRRVNSGLWTRMIDEYWRKRTAFYLANAAYLATLLPDDAAYYQSLGDNPKLPQQAKTPEAERKRLLDQAATKLEPFVNDASDEAGVRMPSLALAGRVEVARGDVDPAVRDLFEPVIGDRQGNLADIDANLGKANALALRRRVAGLDMLRALQTHPVAETDPRFRLLLVDNMHRLLLEEAAKAPADERAAAMARAYEPYLELLNSRDVPPAVRDYLRFTVYNRWAQGLDPDDDITALPPAVRMAIGQIATTEGQNGTIEAQETGDETLLAEARESLGQSVRVNQTLIGDEIPPNIRAQAMYNLAISRYWLAPDDVNELLGAATVLVDVAEDSPSHPVAELAITDGMSLLRVLYEQAPGVPGVIDTYRRGARVLFKSFPTSAAADNERAYYGLMVQQQGGDYEAAIATYAAVPFDHPTYFDAQRETLFALEALAERASGDDAAARRAEVVRKAEQVRAEAQGAMADADPARAASAASAVAGARLALAQVAADEGRYDDSLAYLEGFDEQFAELPPMRLQGMSRRVLILLDAERMDEAAEAARQMMDVFPDEAAGVIDGLLTDLDARIADLRERAATEIVASRKQELEGEATGLAETASAMAEVLASWARARGFDAEQMLPFDLMSIRAARLAGEPGRAVDMLGPVFNNFGDDAGVISEYANALFALGMQQIQAGDRDSGETNLIAAAGQYDRLIGGLGEPYPPDYWNAWAKRLSINDALGENTEDIPFRVRQLRLTDPNLGGPVFRTELEKLEQKHAN